MEKKDIEEIETLLSNLSFWNVLDTDEQCELRTTLTQHHEAEVERAVEAERERVVEIIKEELRNAPIEVQMSKGIIFANVIQRVAPTKTGEQDICERCLSQIKPGSIIYTQGHCPRHEHIIPNKQ